MERLGAGMFWIVRYEDNNNNNNTQLITGHTSVRNILKINYEETESQVRRYALNGDNGK